MHKLLMIDDEDVIRTGFRERINWSALGFEFLEPCCDGVQGLRAVEAFHPDVVITDIRMPRMDGLELCRLLARDHPEVRVVVLSGHDEFEYARQAMRHRAYDFLLKPLTAEELRQFLVRLKADLGQPPVLSEAESVRRLVEGTMVPGQRIPLGEWADQWPAAAWCAAKLVAFPPADRDPAAVGLLVDEILKKRPQPWSGLAASSVVHRGRAVFLDLVFPGADPGRASLRAFRDTLGLITLIRQSGLRCGGALSNPRKSVQQLPEAHREATQATILRLVRSDVLSGGPIPHSRVKVPGTLAPLVPRLAALLREGDVDAVEPFLAALDRALDRADIPAAQLYKDLRKIVEVLPSDESPDEILETSADRTDWRTAMERRILSTLAQAQAQGASLAERALCRFQEVVETLFEDPELRIDEVSRRLQVSPSYLSKLLRSRRSTNFLRSVLEIRISKAKELLVTTNLTTTEVAERVGYHDYRYFSQQFKRQTGTTPTGWRSRPRIPA